MTTIEDQPPAEPGATRRQLIARSAAAVAGASTLGAFLAGCDLGGGDGGPDKPPARLGRAPVSGAAWHLEGSPRGTLAYRGPHALSTPTIQIATADNGAAARAVLARTAPVDLHGRMLRFRLRIDPAQAGILRQINIRLGSGPHAFERSAYQTIELVRRGSDYLTEYAKPGEWAAPTIVPASIASDPAGSVDFGAVRDFAVEVIGSGGGPASVLFGGIELLPQSPGGGVVTITFDDGVESQYSAGAPVLADHGYAATTYLIPGLVGGSGYLSIEQALELRRQGWEIGVHSNSDRIHNAPRGIVGLPATTVRSDWDHARSWLRDNQLGKGNALAYPSGFFDTRTLSLVRDYAHFRTARTTSYRSVETVPPADPLRLRTISFDKTVPIGPASRPGSIDWRIDRVADSGGWLILGFREVVSHRRGPTDVTTAELRRILARIARRRLPVKTVGEVAARPVPLPAG